MDKVEQFYDTIKTEMTVTLATSDGDSVTMRVVSPVYYDGGVLIFTGHASRKYAQLRANPHCCIGAGLFFTEADAEFFGSTMSDVNKAMHDAYCAKFPGAFDEGVDFGGRECEFILLKPRRISGWAFENDNTTDGIPTVPFSIVIS